MSTQYLTGSDYVRAGPLYNPHHSMCQQARAAMGMHRLVRRVLAEGEKVNHELIEAKRDMFTCSEDLRIMRGVDPRYMQGSDPEAFHAREIKRAMLAVLSSHDRVWAAQRKLAMFQQTYGVIE